MPTETPKHYDNDPPALLKRTVPVSLLILTLVLLTGMALILYGYWQDRPFPLYLGLGLSVLGGFFGALRIALWGDHR